MKRGFNDRLFALCYPYVMCAQETGGLQETRSKLVAQAHGRTLEIGAGSGFNLAHYTGAVTELVISEPSPYMMRHLQRKLSESPPSVGSWELVQAGVEELPFPDNSFDSVVATFVHCTIPDSPAAMLEINRLLRPDGLYLFLEHVRARRGTVRGLLQDLVARPHQCVCAGCYPNRDTEATLQVSPLAVQVLEHAAMPWSWVWPVRPMILGQARAVAP